MRLIDADELVVRLKEWRGDKEDVDMSDPHDVGYYAAMGRAIKLTNSALTIAAVPVVRCKDCVHSAPLEGYASRKFETGLNCRACRGDNGFGITGLSFTVPDGYCDDGLRRAGEAHD